jgi:ferredoxin
VEAMQAMADYAVDLCVQYSGAMSGEHGDGLSRSVLNPRLFGPTLYAALQTVKRTFDPHNLLNPGKIVDAPPLTENLRMGPDYKPIELTTIFDWQADHGFAGAIEMCNGAGVCRKLGAGTMCPSYMATKDEHDTTRARANSLRNALAGRIPQQELYSEEMYGVMDLCLGCKACKSECPSSVDMAKIKAEYLVHYYQHNGLPLFNRLMGWLPSLNELLYQTIGRLAIGDWRLGVALTNHLVSTQIAHFLSTRIPPSPPGGASEHNLPVSSLQPPSLQSFCFMIPGPTTTNPTLVKPPCVC